MPPAPDFGSRIKNLHFDRKKEIDVMMKKCWLTNLLFTVVFCYQNCSDQL